jgi:type II secretory pathway pseudopilin PulG
LTAPFTTWRLMWADERGAFTVSVLVIASALALLISAAAFGGLVSATQTESYLSQESIALAELRTATERFGKEVRQARVIYADSTSKMVHFWVDSDRDHQQNLNERISWEIVATSEGMAQLQRRTDAGMDATIHAQLVDVDAFSYAPAPTETTVITATFSADTRTDDGGDARPVRTEIRLRNADF